MSKFITELDITDINDRTWKLKATLVYQSDLLNRAVWVPRGFVTDLASVPRVPIAYRLWGGRAHREAVVHDYLYRIDSVPVVSRTEADKVFLEAMKVRGKSFWVRIPMYFGVVWGGWTTFHRKKVSG